METVASAPTSRLWLVKVDCWHMQYRRADPKRVKVSYIVEADDSDSALVAGRNIAEVRAEFGPKWIRFEAREASTVTIPFKVSR